MACVLSADFFSAMYELSAITSQQSASSVSVKHPKEERKIIKSVWLGKKPEKRPPSLTHESIKSQIGNCTICFRLPKPDCVQLPVCLCLFCRDCFYTYLDNFAISKPVVEKVFISRDCKNWNRARFAGIFDANLLSHEGTAVPIQVKTPKPNFLTKACHLENRNSRIRRKTPDDTTWFRIVKNEQFDCPNCHQDYENINRSHLKKNRAVSDILQLMLENECKENDKSQ